MSAPQSTRPFTEQEARDLAHAVATQVLAPLKGWASALPEEEVTIAGLIRIGVMFYELANESFRDSATKELNRRVMTKIYESLHTPDALENFFFELFLERGRGEPIDIQNSIAEVHEHKITPRKIREAVLEALPKARRGRPKQCVSKEQEEAFLKEARELMGPCAEFLDQRVRRRGRSSSEILGFLMPESPVGYTVLLSSVDFIDKATKSTAFRRRKEIGTRARDLAIAVSGHKHFDWKYAYSLQQAGIFQRARRAGK